jgi:hypothetical protein
MRLRLLLAAPTLVLLAFPAAAETAYQRCAREVGIQLDSTGRRSIQTTWHFRTHEAFERCMEQFRRSGAATELSPRASAQVNPSCRPPYQAATTAGARYKKCTDTAYRARFAASGNREYAADAAVAACRPLKGSLVASVAKCGAGDSARRFQAAIEPATRARLMRM